MVEVGGGRARISAELPLGVAVVGVWLAWAWFDGGFQPSLWGSLGAALVALLLIGGPVLRWSNGDRLRLIAGVALLLFVVWNFLSLAWAQFPGEAWTGADKTAAYAAGFALLAFARFRPRELVLLLGVYAAGVVVIAAVVLGRTALADDPGRWFSDSRLVPPTGYTNASVALWMLAFWPALFLGSTRAAPAPLRPLFLAGAGLLLEIAVLGESRAWAVVLPLTAIVYVLLARERARALLGLAVVGAAMLAVLRPLLDVYERGSAGATLAGPVDHAARATLLSCSVLLLVGLVWTFVDSRPPLPRKLNLGIAVAAVMVVVAGTVWAAARVDHPGRWVSTRWHDFTCQTCGTAAGSSRFTGTLSDNRYREWVVAWKVFLDHPVAGVGADNYAAQYLLMRRDALIEPRYPHSTPLRLLEQLGLVGTLLFAAAVAAAVAVALGRRRSLDAVTGGAVAAAVTVFVYWLLHSSVDWFWEVPALAGPAFGMLGLAAGSTTADLSPAPARARLHPVAVAGAAAVLVAAVVALVLPWLSYRYQQSATSVWRRDPGLAYDRLHRAADLNPLSARPLLLEGSIALARGDFTRAQKPLHRAIGREPHSWYAWLQLGIADAGAGRPARAASDLRRARSLNPKDPVVALAARLLHRGIALDPGRLDALYGTVERQRFGT
jgi:hypothetical protein